MEHIEANTLSDFQPTTQALLQTKIGRTQNDFIGSELLPETLASPDGTEQASYVVFGNDAFFVEDDTINLYGEGKESSASLTWTAVTLRVVGRIEYIDARLVRIAATMGMNPVDMALQRIKDKIATKKEVRQAALLTATGSYASSSYYEPLSGTSQWSHSSSMPLQAIAAKMEFLRGVNGKMPDTLWLGGAVWAALRFNTSILGYIAGGATKQNPGAGIDTSLLESILGLRVLVGGASAATTLGATPSDVWGKNAGLIYTGEPSVVSPKFGATLISAGYPAVDQGVDRKRGGKDGVEWVKAVDAYKEVVTLNTAGYLWTTAVA